jgi:hypothetical protein
VDELRAASMPSIARMRMYSGYGENDEGYVR